MSSRYLVFVGALICGLVAVRLYQNRAFRPLRMPSPASAVETGAHWASPDDFGELKKLGFQFAVVSLDRDEEHWHTVFQAAERVGLRLIAGIHPYPYRLEEGRWVIEPAGRRFIQFVRNRPAVLKALYGFNEPYWVDPATGANTPCGVYSAAELRGLRSAIREIWPDARVYHDFGRPSLWAPGGAMERDNKCVGQKYVDTSATADFAGIWFHPVNAREGYQREELVRAMREEVAYVTQALHAEPVILGQAFRCAGCGEGTRMPNVGEIRDLNCTLRWIAPQAISWYPWRLPSYEETLSAHPELWEAVGPRGCPEG